MKRTLTISAAYGTAGKYTDKNGELKDYAGGVLFILIFDENSKTPAYGYSKKCTREALEDIKGADFPIVNPRLFEDKFERVCGIKI